jgi:L-threonylcarbamoyladenylate synthase
VAIVSASSRALEQAVSRLQQGYLVAFPTETVYGLGADAARPEAVEKIFKVKGRPPDHPVIVHVATPAHFRAWAVDIPDVAYQLAKVFLPGPLTLILKRSSSVPDIVTGGQDTVGLRVPNHPVALELLRAFGGGLAAPSANRFGKISPTTAQHVLADLGEDVSLILDGGACDIGLESTIVDVTSRRVQVLRPGGVGLGVLSDCLGYVPEVVGQTKVRVSGSLESHYAPTTPAFLIRSQDLRAVEDSSGVIALQPQPPTFEGVWYQLPNNAERYGRHLYAALRDLDGMKLEKIFLEQVPETLEWLAVRDRLERATVVLQESLPKDLQK